MSGKCFAMSEEGGICLGSHVPSSKLREKILLQKKKKKRREINKMILPCLEIREPYIDPIAFPSLLLPKLVLLKCTSSGMWIIDSVNNRPSALLV